MENSHSCVEQRKNISSNTFLCMHKFRAPFELLFVNAILSLKSALSSRIYVENCFLFCRYPRINRESLMPIAKNLGPESAEG